MLVLNLLAQVFKACFAHAEAKKIERSAWSSTDASVRFSNYGLVWYAKIARMNWSTWWQQVGGNIWKHVQTTWKRWLPRTRTQTVSIPGNTVIKWRLSTISFQLSLCLASILRTYFGILPFISGNCDRNTRSADNSCVLLEYLSLTKIRPLFLQYIFSSQICQGPVWKLNPETSPRNSGTTTFYEFDQKLR